MADTRKLQLVIDAQNNASQALDKVNKSLDNVHSRLQKAEGASKAFGLALVGAVAGIVAVSAKAVDAYMKQETAEKRLDQIARQVTGSNDGQIESFKKLAIQLQKTGVLGDEVIIAGQSQIASFTKSSEVVTELSDDLADLAVAQYGTKVTQEQAIQTANLLGKALSGQLGALTRTGILVNDELKTAFEAANTEEERAAVISKIVQDNYGGLNKAMRDTAKGGLQALKNKFGDLMETLGEKLIPVVTILVTKLNNFVDNDLPKLIDGISRVVDWFKDNQWAIYAVAGAIVGALVPAVYAMVSSFVAAAVALAPFMLAGAIIAGIVAGIIWIVKNWEMIQQKATEIWNAIANFFKATWDNITGTIKSVWEGIANFFSSIWDIITKIFNFYVYFMVGLVIGIFKLFGIDIVQVFNNIADFFTTFWEDIKIVFTIAINFIKDLWETVWNSIAGFLGPIWEKISSKISQGWTWIKTKFTEATKPIADAWNTLWEGLASGVEIAWEGVKSIIKASINWIIDKINKVINAINKVAESGASVIPGVTAPQIPNIPLLAQGGIVRRPTLAMIGEAGPEAVVPLGRGLAGAGLGNVTINISGNEFLGEEGIAERIGEQIMRAIKNTIKI